MNYIVLDVETVPPNPRDFRAELKAIKPASNIKDPAKMKANVIQRRRIAKEKAALLDSARIACLGLRTNEWTVCFTSFDVPSKERFKSEGIFCFTTKHEVDVLESASAFLTQVITPGIVVITFNGAEFDLPKVRFRYARNNMPIPEIFKPIWKNEDMMLKYTKYFSTKNVPFESLCNAARKLGIKVQDYGNGKDIPRLIKEGRGDEVVLKNVIDLMLTEKIYFRICHEKD